MIKDRLGFACDQGLTFPEHGKIALIGAPGDGALPPVDPARCVVIQTQFDDHARWQDRGIAVQTEATGTFAAAVVSVARARALSEHRVGQAQTLTPDGLIVVDGAKTDGVEPIIKALKKQVTLRGQESKARGKVVWFDACDALRAWVSPEMSQNADGAYVAPGVFSADGADPGSVALAAALPDRLKGRYADLGAGWGWLSREILRQEKLTELHMIEIDHAALACARRNVTDPRAQFHWADATSWSPSQPLDGVVMNPPFHVGRKAEPALGAAFIASAARILASHGQLWMVANRHLPYETTLASLFRECTEVAGDSRFKILHAARPTRKRR